MILSKKWTRCKVKLYIYCVNQECKQKQSRMFNFRNIFYLLASRTQKIACWPQIFKPDFYIFPYNEKLKKI